MCLWEKFVGVGFILWGEVSKCIIAKFAAFIAVCFAMFFICFSCCTPAYAAYPDHIVNGNFSYPGTRTGYFSINEGKYYWGRNVTAIVPGYDRSKFGWTSTQPFVNNSEWYIPAGTCQLMRLGGKMAAELEAHTSSTLYQTVSSVPNGVYKWTVSHMSIEPSHVDTISVLIGNSVSPLSNSAQYAYRTSVNGSGDRLGGVGYVFGTKVLQSSYGGTFESYTGTYVCPAGQYTTSFAFKAVSSWAAQNGNAVTDISFTLSLPLLYDLNGGSGTGFVTSINTAKANNYQGYHVKNTSVSLTSSVPYRSGYTFLGWSKEKCNPATNKSEYDALISKRVSSVSITNNVNYVYALWAKNSTVTFKSGYDNSVLKTQTVTPGSSATAPSIPSYTGYTFTGWNNSYTSVYADVVVTANYSENNYSITYLANGGQGLPPDKAVIAYTSIYNISNEGELYRTYWRFDGWNTESDGSGDSYVVGRPVSKLFSDDGANLDLYAQWEPIRGTLKIQKRDFDSGSNKSQGDAVLTDTVLEIVCVDSPHYESNEVVATLNTNVNGYAQVNLMGGQFKVHEVSASVGYEHTTTDWKNFEIVSDGQVIDMTSFENSFINKVVRGGLTFSKLDDVIQNSQGDGTLEGAEFKVYNISSNPVLIDSVEYPTYKGQTINCHDTSFQACLNLITNKDGLAYSLDTLPYGTYVICEVNPPEGYLINKRLESGVTFQVRTTGEIVRL